MKNATMNLSQPGIDEALDALAKELVKRPLSDEERHAVVQKLGHMTLFVLQSQLGRAA